ncbi:MAG: methionine synthase [Methanobacteriaceae archaeon]|nr:methionine synthase [Methanobacteriaceae archaeon]
MLTTVVGSYPSPPHEPASLTSKISSLLGNYDPFKLAVEYAASEQIKAGINIISTGQVRGDMVEIFSRHIPGMAWEEGTSKIKGKILPLNYSIGAEDIKIALKIAKNLSKDFQSSPDPIKNGEFQEKARGVKGIITGPTTLALSSRIEGFYTLKTRDKAIIDLAYALNKEAKYLEKAGAAMIQFDEPFLSTGMADIKTAYKAIEIATTDIKVPLAMHVCGDVGQVFEELLQFPVDIIDCEFAGMGKNLQLLENVKLKDKKIGFGCVDTKTERVESTLEIQKLLEKGVELVGKDKLIVDPDCGMRTLPQEVAFNKLKNMTEVVGWLS